MSEDLGYVRIASGDTITVTHWPDGTTTGENISAARLATEDELRQALDLLAK
jgi:hypothetical protein